MAALLWLWGWVPCLGFDAALQAHHACTHQALFKDNMLAVHSPAVLAEIPRIAKGGSAAQDCLTQPWMISFMPS